MITKQELKQLESMVQSSNIQDILLAGPMILGLRNSKQLKRRQVNNLFSLLLSNKLITVSHAASFNMKTRNFVPRSWEIWAINSPFGNFLSGLTFKWKWLNGDLQERSKST